MVAAGSNQTAAVTDDGKLYTWGCGRDGRLGHGGSSEKGLILFLTLILTIMPHFRRAS